VPELQRTRADRLRVRSLGTLLTLAVLAALVVVLPVPSGGATEAPTVSIGDLTVVEGNNGTRAVLVPVTLSAPLTTKLLVNYKTVAGTAMAGSDYVAKTGKVAIPAGKTAVSISVTVKADVAPEADETLSLLLTGTNDPSVTLRRTDGTIKIVDDEALGYGTAGSPTVSIGDIATVEGNAGTRTVTLPLTLSSPLTENLTVRYATADGTATKPGDYKAKSNSVSFAAGKVSAAISVVVAGETSEEPDENFVVTLSAPTGPAVTFAKATATVAILDDDVPPATAPDAPLAPTVELVGDEPDQLGLVDVSWMPPADDGRTSIIDYEIEMSHDGTTWLPIASTGTVLTYRHDCGLTAISCAYRVTAVNAVGSSPSSAASVAVVTQAPPDAPATPLAMLAPEEEALGSVDVSWSPPDDPGSLPISGYALEVSVDAGPFESAGLTGPDTTQFRHECGLPAITCVYRVSAISPVAPSSPSEPSLPVVTPGTPDAVGAPAAALAGAAPGELGAIDVSWDLPTSAVTIVGYLVEVSTDSGASWQATSYAGTERAFRHPCGLPALTCIYRVTAYSAAGASPPSAASDPVTTQDVPVAPDAPIAELEAAPEFPTPIPGRIRIRWTPPPNDGGAPITGYRVEVSTDAGSHWSEVGAVDATTNEVAHDCGLPIITCSYRVTATNDVGSGPSSSSSASVTTQGTPAAPGAPAAMLVGTDPANLGFAALHWTAPSSDGGSPVSSYALEVSSDAGSSWSPVILLPSAVTGYSHFCGLPAATCTYRISAGNAVGLSMPSNASAPITTQGVPAAPGAPTATPAGPEPDHDGLIDIVWTAPDEDGGAPVTGYQLQHSKDDGGSWQSAADVDADTTSYAVACGTAVVRCAYRVVAVNGVGPSEPSASSNTVVGRTGPLNIILVMTDDQAVDSMPYYMPYTSTLDSREEGVWTFDQAVADSPLCGPSRMSSLTALTVDHHGVNCNTGGFGQCEQYDIVIQETYPVWLKAAGYSTSYNGKYINRYPCPSEGDTAGWPNPPGWDDWHAVKSDAMAFGNKFNAIHNGVEVQYNARSGGVPVGPQAYGTYLFGDLAQENIETCVEPCLTVYTPTAPHAPAGLPDDYDNEAYPLPGMLERQPSFNEGCFGVDPADDKPALLLANITCPGANAKSRSVDQKSLQAVDREIEDLVEAAKARGVWDRTVLIFTSDHGLQAGNNNINAKSVPYEMSIRVPLLIRIPTSAGGQVTDLVTLTDVTATIAELAGATTPTIDGRSLVPRLSGEAAPRDAAYISLPVINDDAEFTVRPWFSIRQDCVVHTPCYKIVKYPPSVYQNVSYGTEWELYNLTADPYELQNLMPNAVTGYAGVAGWDTPEVLALQARLEQAIVDGDIG
jgi:arylsulfatase A-like enzyme